MKWDYLYDKESTWFDEESGEERYPLESNTAFLLPHMREKKLEILSVVKENDKLRVELRVDRQPATVCSGEEPIVKHVSDSYMVCGDFVSKSLTMSLSIETN